MNSKPTYEDLERRIQTLEREITERKEIEKYSHENESLFRALFEQAGGYCMLLQPTDNGVPNILDANKAACKTHGYERSEMIGMPVINLDDEEGKLLCLERTRIIMSGKTLAIQTNHIRKDGSVFPVAVFANKIELAGKPPIIMTTEHDISEIEEKIAERTKGLLESNIHLEELSLTDALTRLPNRRYAMQQLANYWEESTKHDTPLVCIMIDSDNFKEVNDTYGHDAGDAVLCGLAETLRQTIRNTDMACRLGGDEFLIICPDTDLDSGLSIAELVCKAISTRYEQDSKEVSRGSASAGVAARSPDMKNYENLIKAADNSVYEAKRAGKNCVRTIS